MFHTVVLYVVKFISQAQRMTIQYVHDIDMISRQFFKVCSHKIQYWPADTRL